MIKIVIHTALLTLTAITLTIGSPDRREKGWVLFRLIFLLNVIMQQILSLLWYWGVFPSDSTIAQTAPFAFLFGPLIYLMYRDNLSLPISSKILQVNSLSFLIPLVFYLFVNFILPRRFLAGESYVSVWYLIILSSWFFYASLTLYMIIKYRAQKIKSINPLALFITFYSFIMVIVALPIIHFRLTQFGDTYMYIGAEEFYWVFQMISVLMIYFGMISEYKTGGQNIKYTDHEFQSRIMDLIRTQSELEKSILPELPKSLPNQRVNNIFDQIDFLDPDLNADIQAEKLRIPRTDFNRQIKEETGLTFGAYLNKKRVERLMKILEDTPGMEIEKLIEGSGFGSQASFYRNFKKYAGESPGDFARKKLNSEL